MSSIVNIFSSVVPVYNANRGFSLNEKEQQEIDSVIAEGMIQSEGITKQSENTFLFDSKLPDLRSFCEEHIANYVNKVICPKNKSLEFYITQSWLNVTKQNEHHVIHNHPNSIISGVYYFTDNSIIIFTSPFANLVSKTISIESEIYNSWNFANYNECGQTWNKGTLILFPSYLTHRVPKNKSLDVRVSLSFNVFVRGELGTINNLTYLDLK